MSVYVDETLCKSCGLCVANCPKQVLALGDKVNRKGYNYVQAAKPEDCISCGMCARICPDFALYVER